MALDLGTLSTKANQYKSVLENTKTYRSKWATEIKPLLTSTLEEILSQTEIKGKIEVKDKMINLEAIVLNLGTSLSGIAEVLEDTDIKRPMIKNNGGLIYQQLFNGKVMVMFALPYIEGYGEPKGPKMVEVLRPEELTQPFITRHVEMFLSEVIDWEDYDDDDKVERQSFNPIGFQRAEPEA